MEEVSIYSESTVTGGGDEAVLEVRQITAPPEYQNQLQHLISLNKDLFAETDKDLGRTTDRQTDILLTEIKVITDLFVIVIREIYVHVYTRMLVC